MEHQKGVYYRAQSIITKLGLNTESSVKMYSQLSKREKKSLKEKYVQLERKLNFSLFIPNLIYKTEKFEISTSDYVYLVENFPRIFRFIDYRKISVALMKFNYQQEIYAKLFKQIQFVDKQVIYYKNNFAVVNLSEESQSIVETTRIAQLIEQITIISNFMTAQHRYQTSHEAKYCKDGQAIGAPAL